MEKGIRRDGFMRTINLNDNRFGDVIKSITKQRMATVLNQQLLRLVVGKMQQHIMQRFP